MQPSLIYISILFRHFSQNLMGLILHYIEFNLVLFIYLFIIIIAWP